MAAGAEGQQIATVTHSTPVSSASGWTVWSELRGARWQLFAWHDGRAKQLTRRGRMTPFDADVGTDGTGAPVVTFSRCRKTPGLPDDGPALGAGAGEQCRLRLIALRSGVETAISVPHTSDDSDTHPSMWQGAVAFARTQMRSLTVSQVWLRSARGHQLSRMHGGSVPTACGSSACSGDFTVEGLDLGPELLAFNWHLDGSKVAGADGWEVRADRLRTGTSLLVGDGGGGETCTGGTDTSLPSAPSVVGQDVWYAQLNLSCYVPSSLVVRVHASSRRSAIAALGGAVLAASVPTSSAITTLTTTAPVSNTAAPSCSAAYPCTIAETVAPALMASQTTFVPPLTS